MTLSGRSLIWYRWLFFIGLYGVMGGLAPLALAQTKKEGVRDQEVGELSSVPASRWPWHIVYQSRYTSLYVDKNQRKVSLFEGSLEGIPQLTVTLDADIGKNAGDKQRENDHRTPEGIYFFQKKIFPPEISFELYGNVAVTTDYPNVFDRMAGKTGYGIWLHAVPDNVPLTRGSRGCVVVSNQAITSLAEFIQLGKSPFVIVPESRWESHEVMKKVQGEFLAWLEDWRKTWEKQDIDTYLEFYHPDFVGNGKMNREQWRRHKLKIKRLYTNVRITVEPRLVLQFKDQWVTRFHQSYTSDQHYDVGEKVLYLLKQDSGTFRIIREDWVGDPPAGDNI